MHPQDAGSFLQGDGVQYCSAVQCLVGCAIQQFVYHALAAHAHQQRQLKHVQHLLMRQQFVVVVECLGKPIPWVEDDVLLPQVPQLLNLLRKIQHHLLHQIIVVRRCLHGLGSPFHVHQDVWHTQLRHRLEHSLVQFAARDVVDDVSSQLFHTHLRHVCTKSVHTHRHLWSILPYHLHATSQSCHFLLCTHIISAWA